MLFHIAVYNAARFSIIRRQVLEVLALRRFGWRTFSQFSIDFRKADALKARRLWLTSSFLTAITYLAFLALVLMSTTGIVLFASPALDIEESLAVPVLVLNCIDLVYSTAVFVAVLWVVRERSRHRCVGEMLVNCTCYNGICTNCNGIYTIIMAFALCMMHCICWCRVC